MKRYQFTQLSKVIISTIVGIIAELILTNTNLLGTQIIALAMLVMIITFTILNTKEIAKEIILDIKEINNRK